MNKKSSLPRALLVAGTLAVAGLGAAQADAIFYPDGTVVDLGVNGADTLALDSSLDTTALGAGPAMTTTTTTVTVPVTEYVYVQPNIDFDRTTALHQIRDKDRWMHRHDHALNRTGASVNYGVSDRVNGEERILVGQYTIPASAMSDPYYVFSY